MVAFVHSVAFTEVLVGIQLDLSGFFVLGVAPDIHIVSLKSALLLLFTLCSALCCVLDW